jgi:hypothetical protein
MRRVSGTYLFALIAFAVVFLSACGSKGELRPLHAEEDSGGVIGDQPQLVTFAELQAEPEAYKNTLIRVTGTYYRLSPPDCIVYSGPDTNWSLIVDNLRLDSQGFERSIQIVSDGVELTVDGIFRKYEGPLGCGKRPDADVAWFLETTQIIQPNPLSRVIGTVVSGQPPLLPPGSGSPTPPGTIPANSSATPTIVISPSPTRLVPTATPSLVITTIGTATPTPSPSSGTSIPTMTPSPTQTLGPGTPSVTPSTTPAPLPGTPTQSPTNPAQPTLGPTQPPLSTSTPGAYPIPPTIEPSPTGYPIS